MRIRTQNIVDWLKKQPKIAVALIGGLIVGGAGSAAVLAAIPGTGNVIHACYRSGGLLANGSVRIIDNTSSSCNSNETAITWNQTGPQGPAGPAGPAGSGAPGEFLPNLVGAKLTHTNLASRDFAGVDLHDSDLSNTNLTNSDFEGANLSNVQFNSQANGMLRSDLTNANFEDADLTNADFSGLGLVLANANFTNTDLTNATFDSIFNSDMHGNFTNTNFTNVSFSTVSLAGVDLTSATLTGTTWSNVVCPDSTNSNNNGNTCIGHLAF